MRGNAANSGGGVYRGTLYNSTLTNNTANSGGGAYDSMLYNCAVRGNEANSGGGVMAGVLYDCTLTGNAATNSGGGAYDSTLHNSTLTGNSALSGGGSYNGTLYNCTLSGNVAVYYGGGTFRGTLYNCMLTNNTANSGGGAYDSIVYDSALSGNSALSGGGSYHGTLYNCTLAGNAAVYYGGGTMYGALYNSIVYYNTVDKTDDNCMGSTLEYCCTTLPDPGGTGNLFVDPMLASATHLGAGSPCIGAGSTNYSQGADMDGELWLSPPSMGCDEYRVGAVTGAVSVKISAASTNRAIDRPIAFAALITGRLTASRWSFGDGAVVSNQPYISHAWSTAGVYTVTLAAFNEDHPAGVSTSLQVSIVTSVRFVNVSNTAPSSPFSNWATAATNIQDAIDVANDNDTIWVSNGVYAAGSRMTTGAVGLVATRVAITKPVTVQSVNGPAVTIIDGGASMRGVYMVSNAVLGGFTVTNGQISGTNDSGGGVYCESRAAVVSNCTLSGNSAYFGGGIWRGTLYSCVLSGNSSSYGGGSAQSALYNCLLTANSAYSGGGAYDGALYSCTLSRNFATNTGGGAATGQLYNCISYSNPAAGGGANYTGTDLFYCCTTPDPGGPGNITGDPMFVDATSGDFRLVPGSPAMDAGANAYMQGASDLAGNPRLSGARVDMGAYEYQSLNLDIDTDMDTMPDAWEIRYGLNPTESNPPLSNVDGDLMTDREEYIADTNPNDSNSWFHIEAVSNAALWTVYFQSSTGRQYTLELKLNLPQTSSWLAVSGQTNQWGNGARLGLSDALRPATSAFYRVEAQLP